MNKSFCLFERFATRHRKEVVDIFLSWRLRQQKERRRVHLTRLLLDGIELVLHSTLKIIKPIRHTHADSLKKGEVGKTIDYATKERAAACKENFLAGRHDCRCLLASATRFRGNKKIVAMSVPGRAMQSRNTCADRTRGWPPSTSFSTIVNTFSPSSLNIEKKRVFSTTFSLRWEVIDTCAGKVKNIIISLWYHRPRLYPVQGEEAKSAVNFVRKLTTSKICSLNILTTLGIISLGNQGTIVKTSYRNRLLGSISWMLDGHQLTACWRKRWLSFAILD